MRTLTRQVSSVVLGLASVTGLLVMSAPEAEAATPCVKQSFGYDLATKQCVVYLQKLVNSIYAQPEAAARLGGKRTLEVDGKYGDKTVSAVTNIQKHANVQKPSLTWIAVSERGTSKTQTWAVLCLLGTGSSTKSSAGCSSANLSYVGAEIPEP